jgi:hypothetical protein
MVRGWFADGSHGSHGSHGSSDNVLLVSKPAADPLVSCTFTAGGVDDVKAINSPKLVIQHPGFAE